MQPTKETCDNKDNDCDGAIDEDFSNKGKACQAGVGACQKSGVFQCKTDGTGTLCDARPGTPKAETCNNIDDDCNGKIDDKVTRSCFGFGRGCTQQSDGTHKCVGTCRAGTETCSRGTWGACQGAQGPTAEVCDNKDNNCDGTIDEALTRPCYNGATGCSVSGTTVRCAGNCKAGTSQCTRGVWSSTCTGEVTPKPETCDGKDENCNGMLDDGTGGGACYPSGTAGCTFNGSGYTCQGTCQSGTEACTNGVISCQGATTPTAELCGDGKDNDCDGTVDEGFQNFGKACSVGSFGICLKQGTWTCSADKKSIFCGDPGGNQLNPGTPAPLESCNGLDDDCDGLVDEGQGTKTCPKIITSQRVGLLNVLVRKHKASGRYYVSYAERSNGFGPVIAQIRPYGSTWNYTTSTTQTPALMGNSSNAPYHRVKVHKEGGHYLLYGRAAVRFGGIDENGFMTGHNITSFIYDGTNSVGLSSSNPLLGADFRQVAATDSKFSATVMIYCGGCTPKDQRLYEIKGLSVQSPSTTFKLSATPTHTLNLANVNDRPRHMVAQRGGFFNTYFLPRKGAIGWVDGNYYTATHVGLSWSSSSLVNGPSMPSFDALYFGVGGSKLAYVGYEYPSTNCVGTGCEGNAHIYLYALPNSSQHYVKIQIPPIRLDGSYRTNRVQFIRGLHKLVAVSAQDDFLLFAAEQDIFRCNIANNMLQTPCTKLDLTGYTFKKDEYISGIGIAPDGKHAAFITEGYATTTYKQPGNVVAIRVP